MDVYMHIVCVCVCERESVCVFSPSTVPCTLLYDLWMHLRMYVYTYTHHTHAHTHARTRAHTHSAVSHVCMMDEMAALAASSLAFVAEAHSLSSSARALVVLRYAAPLDDSTMM